MTWRVPARGSGAAAVVRALRRALPLVVSPRLIGALLRWLGGSIVLWLVLGPLLYGPVVAGLTRLFGAEGNEIVAVKIGAIVLLIAAALVTVLVAVAVFTMPLIVRLVAERYFPGLERRRGGTWHGGLRNALVATLVFLPAWLACLPLLVVPPLYVLSTWCVGAWFNQRLFRYDALAEHADRDELARLPRGIGGRLFGLGLVLAPLTLVPIVDLLVPLLAGIAFACLCLDALARQRAGSAPNHGERSDSRRGDRQAERAGA